eukprot:scaffold1330_cov240-Pinguiococcus_pyrenoidosus.AAC.30
MALDSDSPAPRGSGLRAPRAPSSELRTPHHAAPTLSWVRIVFPLSRDSFIPAKRRKHPAFPLPQCTCACMGANLFAKSTPRQPRIVMRPPMIPEFHTTSARFYSAASLCALLFAVVQYRSCGLELVFSVLSLSQLLWGGKRRHTTPPCASFSLLWPPQAFLGCRGHGPWRWRGGDP